LGVGGFVARGCYYTPAPLRALVLQAENRQKPPVHDRNASIIFCKII
jgi:hypothetical protein